MTATPIPVPPDLRRYAKYYYAAESLVKYNPIVSQVMRHVFADSCHDDLLPLLASPEPRQFIESYRKNLSSYPCDRPEETRYFANELYDSLTAFLKSGKVSYKLAEQFMLCSVVFSVLEGEEAIHRETTCRIVAGRIKRALDKAKTKTDGRKSSQNLNDEFPDLQGLRLCQSVRPGPSLLDSGATTIEKKKPEKAQPVKPDFRKAYDDRAVTEYLKALGVSDDVKVPAVKESCKARINEDLDMALTMAKMGNRENAVRCLDDALKVWKTGRIPR